MHKNKINPQELLSTLWIFILFNMILRDLHEFPTDGYIEEMMSLKLSEGAMLFYAFIVEIPISMIVLSRLLNNNANKWANGIAVMVSSIGILYTIPSGQLDELFFALVNAAAFTAILITVWKWPSQESFQTEKTWKNESRK